MKVSKYKIIQVLLILAIFIVIITCWASAANSNYTLSAIGEYVTSKDNVETLDVAGFEKHNKLSIRYELEKGKNVIRGAYSLYPMLFDMDGNLLDGEKYPYLYYERTGYFSSDIIVFVDMEKYVEYCKTAVFTDLLNEFQISFETRDYNDNGELISAIELDRRTIRLVKDGQLCDASVDAELATVGEVKFTPVGYQNKVAFTELNFETIDFENNVYNANLEISLGEKEANKAFAFDVSILSKQFPYRDMIPKTSGVVHIDRLDGSSDYYSEVSFGNTVLDPLRNDKGAYDSLNIGNGKFLIVQSSRSLNTNGNNKVENETDTYKIVFDTFNTNKKVTLILNVIFNFEEAHKTELGTCLTYDGYLSQRHLYISSPLELNSYFNYYPYKVVLENSEGEVCFINTLDFTEYWLNKDAMNSQHFDISLSGNLPSGYYTLKGYEYEGNITQNIDGSYVVPDDEDLTISTINKFYIESLGINKVNASNVGNVSLGYVSEGKNFNVEENDMITLDVYTNENKGKSVFAFYGNLKDSKGYTLSSNLNFKVVSSLIKEEQKPLKGISMEDGILYINGSTDVENFYLLVSTDACTSYVSYRIKINHISYQEYVMYYKKDKETVIIPSNLANPKVNLEPKLVVDGRSVDIKDYDYSYKVLNLDETTSKTMNIIPTKDDNGDYVTYNDLAGGAYLIRCYLTNMPTVYCDFELIVSTDDSLVETFEYKVTIDNQETEVAVPKEVYQENRIKILSSVYRNDELTTMSPSFSVVGDTGVSIRKNYLIIDSTATIGNSVVVTATLDIKGIDIKTSKTFLLVEQTDDNDDNIVDEEDPSGPGKDPSEGGEDDGTGEGGSGDGNEGEGGNGGDEGGSGTGGQTSYIVPSDVKLVLKSGILINGGGTVTETLSKPSGERFVLKYACFDENGREISRPSVSINLYWNDATGTSVVKDYVNKELEFSTNGIYSDRIVTIEFVGNGETIDTFELKINKPTKFISDVWFVQDEFIRGGKIEARARIFNNSIDEVSFVLVVCSYDKNDKILSIAEAPISIKSGESTLPKKEGAPDYISAEITLPFDLEDVTVKAFLLEGTSIRDGYDYFHGAVTLTNREVW